MAEFNEELYAEMLSDDGIQYDSELRQEIVEYYLNQE